MRPDLDLPQVTVAPRRPALLAECAGGRTLHVTSVEDLPELHQEVVIGGAGLYWRSKGRMMGGQEFGDLLFSGVPLSAVARDADGSLVALLEVVSLDVESGHAELAAVVASGYRRSSAVIDVAGPFCAEAFRKFPIRKLYALFSEGSGVEPSSLERLGFVLEGTLREYVWIDGAHRDVSVCAVDRSTVELRVRATSVEVTGLAVLLDLLGRGAELDSLSLAEIHSALEDELGREVIFDSVAELRTVEDVTLLAKSLGLEL